MNKSHPNDPLLKNYENLCLYIYEIQTINI